MKLFQKLNYLVICILNLRPYKNLQKKQKRKVIKANRTRTPNQYIFIIITTIKIEFNFYQSQFIQHYQKKIIQKQQLKKIHHVYFKSFSQYQVLKYQPGFFILVYIIDQFLFIIQFQYNYITMEKSTCISMYSLLNFKIKKDIKYIYLYSINKALFNVIYRKFYELDLTIKNLSINFQLISSKKLPSSRNAWKAKNQAQQVECHFFYLLTHKGSDCKFSNFQIYNLQFCLNI
ncbi:hypothetical protein TTHERM_000177941 (macronuclear) [Tetrahymena thermophila SB210]|uniref:Uncharacterized protein n=1 Tax=Tetrahymena thermophila (strain SB210) TaxID=312017 RepID=W7X9X4_TETTS|nr:hypothetical protein TTHERM_000177941 [Tetrahymena thermophila SB210]EWS76210.1 hypothetical protein TTHERM_000177941 [Tetrahymena thermophila SB210]|eukprot:XP_012651257.1 hypothetical protein TTHERM_000177941 [Tetrahymena thermophila SB210]